MASAVKKRARTKKTPNPKYESLGELLILRLQSLHDIENQILKALPKMAKAATDEDLREAFTSHLEETRGQEERIDRALKMLGDTGKGKSRVEAIRGLIADAEWIIKSVKNPAARDAILIAAAQYVEHYEMAGYGTAREWAERLGRSDVAALLEETLREEVAANAKLNKIALESVNEQAHASASNA